MMDGVHTSVPAVIESYNHVLQSAKVQPVVRRKFPDGTLVSYPVVGDVPVLFPQGAGGSITFPLAPGDFVWLVVAETSIDEWLALGISGTDPSSVRSHNLSDALAIPGPRPFTGPQTEIDPVAMVVAATLVKLGSNAAFDFVALASLVATQLTAIINAFNLHVHAANGVPPTVPMPPAGPVAATKVQAE
jgi:hypothetical protein